MNRASGLDIERKARTPDLLGRFSLAAIAAIARNLELRHGRASRHRKWNFKTPARRCLIEPRRCKAIRAIRQGCHLQQRLARQCGIGIREQMMDGGSQRCIGRECRPVSYTHLTLPTILRV